MHELKGGDVESKYCKKKGGGYANRESGRGKSRAGFGGSGHQIKEFTPCHLRSVSKESESPDDRGANFHLNIYMCYSRYPLFLPSHGLCEIPAAHLHMTSLHSRSVSYFHELDLDPITRSHRSS